MRRVGRAKPKRESNSASAEAIVRPGTPNIERDFKRKSNCDFAFSLFNMAATGPTCTGGADIGKREDPRDEASKELYLFYRAACFRIFQINSQKKSRSMTSQCFHGQIGV